MVILRIAEELELPHNYAVADPERALETTVWEPAHFRLFVSHLASFKKTTGLLQSALRQYGISGFVAHVDIEPTREWQDEIEAGLFSMDALAAILMPGFKDSNWTDQEIGVALGRGVLVIPVMRGLTPYGFISKYQGLYALDKTVAEVAEDIFQILVTSSKTRARMLSCLVNTILQSTTERDALVKLSHLSSLKKVPLAHLEKMREAAPSSVILSSGAPLTRLNELLAKYKLKPVALHQVSEPPFDDDIPF